MNQFSDLEGEAHQKEIIFWSTLSALYFIFAILMIAWQNKLTSDIFAAKFCALFLASLLKLSTQFTSNRNVQLVLIFFGSCSTVFEQFVVFILFHELYLAICKMEKREYAFKAILRKIGVACIASTVHASIFLGIKHYYKNRFLGAIEEICLSFLVLIALIICFVNVMMTLVENGKSRKSTLAKKHLIIHLMIVLLLTQISKLITLAIPLSNQKMNDKRALECPSDMETGKKENCVLEVANLMFATRSKENYLSVHICSLGESVYILGLMILKKTSCWCGRQ